MSDSVCVRAFECPAHEFFGVGPDIGGVGLENDDDDGATVEGAGGDEAAAGGVGGAGFHTVNVWEALEQLVGVLNQAGAAVIVSEGESFRPEITAKQGAAIGNPGSDSHIAGGGVLAGFGQAVGI